MVPRAVPGASRDTDTPGSWPVADAPVAPDLFQSLGCAAVPRVGVTSLIEQRAPGAEAREEREELEPGDAAMPAGDDGSQPIGRDLAADFGALVHRLFQRVAGQAEMPDAGGPALDPRVLHPGLLLGTEEAARVTRRAAEVVAALRAHPQLSPLIGNGRWRHEVPFSMVVNRDKSESPEVRKSESHSPGSAQLVDRPVPEVRLSDSRTPGLSDSVIVRGVIDSLVETSDGVTVVELKTGRARPQHQAQLDLYVAAAKLLYPGRTIRGMVVYPE
jgi:ATP-dependent exoDNAse (exonuclease V) beta subunit